VVRNRTVALVVLCAGALMVILDQTIVNVALPTIRADLGLSQAGLAWVVNGYMITFGGLLLLAGRLGDLLGRRRVFRLGLAVFTLASLLCGLATSGPTLVAARFLQGVGGALSSAVVLGMIVAMYPEPGARARPIGVFSFVGAAGASIGLIVGGVLTQAANWHWIFFVNVPVGVAAILLSGRVLPADAGTGLRRGAQLAGATPGRPSAAADVSGALLVTSALMLGVYAIVTVPDHGWTAPVNLAAGVAALALLAGFLAREASAAAPLLPLHLLGTRLTGGANLVQALMIAGMMGFQFMFALYLQRSLGYGPAQVGAAFLPIAAGIAVVSLLVSPRLSSRFGPRPVLLAGLALLAAGLGWLSRVPAHAGFLGDLLPVVLLLGAGAGLTLPATVMLAMSGVAEADAGLASGLVNTTQQVGGVLGISVLATLGGYRAPFGTAAGLELAALVVAAVLLPGRARMGRGRGEARSATAAPDVVSSAH
jgi:EmrB/QacA subfamily drug resistance transporter